MVASPQHLARPARSSSKQGVLSHLKRHPDASLEELATLLGVSKVAALGHVRRLESDGLVERSYHAGHVGRPRVHFRLTDEGTTLFPQAYAEMSLCAIEFIERRLGRGAVAELLSQRAADVAERNWTRLRDGSLSSRVAELARIRSEDGYMAEVAGRRRNSVELLEHNCPILTIAKRFPEACETERRLFESMLRAQVDVSHRVVEGDPVCRFLIRGSSRSG
jgi:DeoR family transcriptional regulator, suf operon transcriptional repressor